MDAIIIILIVAIVFSYHYYSMRETRELHKLNKILDEFNEDLDYGRALRRIRVIIWKYNKTKVAFAKTLINAYKICLEKKQNKSQSLQK